MSKSVKFFKDGTTVRVVTLNDELVSDKLEPAVYSLNFNPMQGFYLNYKFDKFTVPEKVYGSATRKKDRVVKTYTSRNKSTGVLLTGEKGAGKTMVSSLIANTMIESGLPVILIENSYSGTDFNEYMNNIGECVIFFDEFAKIYSSNSDEEGQNSLLSLFDGTGSIKRLLLLTENNAYRINEFMLNRPGRVFYHFRHDKIEDEVVQEYCEDMGVDQLTIDKLLLRVSSSYQFSFDTLQAVVEEYQRFGGDIDELCNDLNIEQPIAANTMFQVIQITDAETQEDYFPTREYVDAIRGDEDIYVHWTCKDGPITDDNREHCQDFDAKNIIGRENGELVLYGERKGVIVRVRTVTQSPYTMADVSDKKPRKKPNKSNNREKLLKAISSIKAKNAHDVEVAPPIEADCAG